MFSSVLSSITSSLSSSIKDTALSYKPTEENIHGSFERLAQIGIGNLSFRSPLVADIAEQVLKNFQITVSKKQRLREYIKSSESESLREKVKSKLPETASSKKIDESMMRILEKLDKEVEHSKQSNYKQTELFKEYEDYFKKFKYSIEKEVKQPEQTQERTTSTSDDSNVLNKIQVNTQRTFNALEVLSAQMNTSGQGAQSQNTNSSASFIDPMTGLPSMRAAIGSIGGSFLGKIFDDKLITKYANKVKTKFSLDEDEPISYKNVEQIIPKQSDENIKEFEKSKAERANELVTSVETVLDELIEIHKTIKLKNIEGSKSTSILDGVFSDLEFPELKKRIPGAPKTKRTRTPKVPSKVIDAIASIPDIELNKSPTIEDAVSNSKTKTGYGSKVMNITKGLGSRILSVLNPATKVAAAGTLGYGIGTLLNDGISSGINWATDGKSQSLGDWIYNKTHQKENSLPEVKPRSNIAVIDNLSQIKDANKRERTSKPVVPVLLNNTTTPVASPSIVVAGVNSVRNKESTFERVQMQDFWPRAI